MSCFDSEIDSVNEEGSASSLPAFERKVTHAPTCCSSCKGERQLRRWKAYVNISDEEPRKKGGLTSTELEELVLLEPAGEAESVEGILRIGRIAKSFVVLVLDQQLVVALVDGRNVVL